MVATPLGVSRARIRVVRLRASSATVIVSAVLLICAVVVPLYFVVRSSFKSDSAHGPAGATLDNYRAMFSASSDLPHLLATSVTFAIGAVLFAVPLGTALAWLVERTNTPLRRLVYVASFASLAVPPVVTVIGWILLFGPQSGLLNVWARDIFGQDGTLFNIYSMTGMVLVYGSQSVPMVFLLLAGPMRNLNADLQEAAAMSGASPGKSLFKVTLPLLLPSLIGVAMLMFVNTLESFETPALVGTPGGITVLTTEIYQLLQQNLVPAYGAASSYSVFLMVLLCVGVWLYTRATRQAGRYVTVTGRGIRLHRTDLGRWKPLTTALVVLFALTIFLPMAVILWGSFLPFFGPPSHHTLQHVSLHNYRLILSHSKFFSAFMNSAVIGAVSATAIIVIATLVAWAMVRTRARGRSLLDFAASLPLVVPGIVMGLAILRTYVSAPIPVYGTLWIIVLAYVGKFVPYGVRFSAPALLQVGKELEEGAQMSGSGWLRTVWKVTIPLISASLSAGWIYVFLLTMKELSAALLLYAPGHELLSIEVFSMWGDGLIGELCAFGVLSLLGLVAIALIFRKVSGNRGLVPQ